MYIFMWSTEYKIFSVCPDINENGLFMWISTFNVIINEYLYKYTVMKHYDVQHRNVLFRQTLGHIQRKIQIYQNYKKTCF